MVPFNSEIKNYLLETSKWAKFLSIVGFVFTGLMVILALFISSIMSALAAFGGESSVFARMAPMMTVIYLIMAAVYFVPYLYKFAGKTKEGILIDDESTTTEGISKLKSFFKFWGICTIVILSLYAVILLFAIIGGVSAALMR